MGLNGTGTATITPNDGAAGGTFSPSGAQSVTYPATATFTYTAASVGTKTISTTNGGGLANATPISYVANTAQGRLLLTANPGDEVRAFGSGALLATLAYDLWVHHPTTGALVVKLSGVTDAAGLLGVVTNPTMGLSTQYRIDYKFSTGEFGSCYRTTEAT